MNEYGEIIGTALEDNGNFIVEVVDWDHRLAVKKSAKATIDPRRQEHMENELYGMRYFEHLAASNPNLILHQPILYDVTAQSYVREYIPDDPIVTPTMGLTVAGPRLGRLAETLAGIDRIEPFGETRFVGSSDYRDIRKNFSKWTERPLSEGLLSQAQLDKVQQIIQAAEPKLAPRIAQGDMSPFKHAYFMPDGKVAFIDFEYFTPNAARYFDVAWAYTRLYSFASSAELPRHFLRSFLSAAETIPYQEEQLLAIIAQRAIGMQYDACIGGEHVDYKNRAAELMELCCENRLEALC